MADEEEDRDGGADAVAGHVAARAVAARGGAAAAQDVREARAAHADDPLHPPPARVPSKLASKSEDRRRLMYPLVANTSLSLHGYRAKCWSSVCVAVWDLFVACDVCQSCVCLLFVAV